jgi:outer membrane protein OmpA-like peptidoglycan-associated protein
MFKRFLASAALLACCLIATGCASGSYAVLIPSPDGSVGKIMVTTPTGSTIVDKEQQAVALDGSSAQPFDVSDRKIQDDFHSAMAAQPAQPVYFQIYFKTGGASLTPESDAFIPSVFATIQQRGIAAVSVIGHTDTVGDPAFNEQLGMLRAQSIAKLLKQKGLQTLEMTVASHGERNLLVKTPDNTPEPKNRRVEISVR